MEDFPVPGRIHGGPSCPIQEQPQETAPRGYTMEHYSKAGTLISSIVEQFPHTFTKNLPKPFGHWEITHLQLPL